MVSITEVGRKYVASSASAWRRFLLTVFGLGLLAAAAWIAAALATYDRGDPSWNQSISAIARNAMGLPGAKLADLMLQWFGIAAWLVPLVLFDWAVRLLLGRGLKRLWLKVIVLPLLLPATSLAVAIVPPPALWPLRVGLGGAIGKLGHDGFAHINVAPPLAAMAAAAMVALLLLYVFGWSFVSFAPSDSGKKRYVRPSTRAVDDDVKSAPGLVERAAALLPAWPHRKLAEDEAEDDAPLRREPRLASAARAEEDVPADEIRPPRRTAKVDIPLRAKNREKARQALLDLVPAGQHLLPPLELLDEVVPSRFVQVSADALQQNARLLESVLADFGVQGQIVKVRPGPVVALYELEPAPGIKASRVIGLADDIARSMSAISARVAVIPGRNVIGIELPNTRAETVYLRELLASEDYERTAAKLALVLGKDIGGTPVIADLARMPHLLIAGTTGSGKSVGINTMILSILYRMPPDQANSS